MGQAIDAQEHQALDEHEPTTSSLELLPEAALHIDASGRMVGCNRAAATMSGLDGSLTSAIHGASGFHGWLAGADGDLFRQRLQARRANGVPITVELSARRIHQGAGGALCLLIEPDSQQVAYEAQLHFDIAFDAAPIGMGLFNTDGEYLRVNSALCKLLGRPQEQLIGRRDQEFTHPDDRQADVDAAWRILQGEIDSWQCEKRFIRPDDETVWVIANLTFLRDARGNPMSWVGQFQDITGRKALEEAALEASRMKSEFLANMSHEIRTPLNGVIGMTGLLLGTDLDSEQKDYAETVRRSGESLLEIINDVLDFSKIEAGKLELERSDFELRDVIEDVADLFATQAQAKRLEVTTMASPEVPPAVSGDPGRVRQVLTNLVGNAIKFTSAGEVAINVSLLEDGDPPIVRIGVRDTGVGIEAPDQRRLFESFTQADASTTRRYGGTGLGLAISKRLTEMMGGTIGVDSTPGHGSEFWFTLPLERAPSAPGRSDPAARNESRILVVDDNTTARSTLVRQLDAWGATVAGAVDARDALERLQTAQRAGSPFDVAVIDSDMPEMDGADLVRAIAGDASLQRLRVVMLTPLGYVRATVDDRAAAHINKPVRQSHLFDAVASVLAVTSILPPPDNTKSISAEAASGLAGLRLLVAEDNPVNQRVAAAMLGRLGLRVDVVGDGREAVEAISRAPYAAVLMDCQMPEMNGYQATEEIRRLEGSGHRTPIIALTAAAMKGDKERCLEAGMDDYLSKPVRMEALAEALSRLVLGSAVANGQPAPPVRSPQPGAVGSDDTSADERLNEDIFEDLGLEDGGSPLIDLFLRETANRIERLGEALESGRLTDATAAAHSLKGSSGSFGARVLSARAAEAEMACKAGDAATAAQLVPVLRSEFDAFHEILAARLHLPTEARRAG